MQLPKGQDVVLDATTWTAGPLPDALEQIAMTLFCRQCPTLHWADPLFSRERNECRRFALLLRVAYLQLDRLTPATAAERLADEFAHLVFGDRRLGPTLRGELQAFSEAVVSDLAITFQHRLVLPAHVEANHAEVEQEANNGR